MIRRPPISPLFPYTPLFRSVGLASPPGGGALPAAIFIVAYLAFSLPAVVAGYAVTRVGLHDAALWYGIVVEILALAGVAGTLLVNPPARQPGRLSMATFLGDIIQRPAARPPAGSFAPRQC